MKAINLFPILFVGIIMPIRDHSGGGLRQRPGVQTANGILEGTTEKSGIRRIQRNSLRPNRPRRRPALETRTTRQELGRVRRAPDKFGPPRPCSFRYSRDMVFPLRRNEWRTACFSMYLDAGQDYGGAFAGAGLLLRRRLRGRRRFGAALRRRQHGRQGRRGRDRQLPASRRIRVPRPSGIDKRVAATYARRATMACSIKTRAYCGAGPAKHQRRSAATPKKVTIAGESAGSLSVGAFKWPLPYRKI